mgnify:CR=1 FL=1
MKTVDLEIAIAKMLRVLPKRKNGNCSANKFLLPNVSYGLGLNFECDLLYITKNRYAHEYELKISKNDIIQDKDKRRHIFSHINDTKIRSRTFVIPVDLMDCTNLIPEKCGIIIVNPNSTCVLTRKAKNNTKARQLTYEEVLHLGNLAAMRLWKFKLKQWQDSKKKIT